MKLLEFLNAKININVKMQITLLITDLEEIISVQL